MIHTGTPHRSLKERQRQERAALILQAAEEVLAEKGYHDTSMDEIAARVGVAKGTVYLHFPSKEDLVFALFEQELVTSQQMIEQAVATTEPAREKLEHILHHTYQGLLGKRMQLLRALFNSMDARQLLQEKKLHLRDRMERLAAIIRGVLEEGKAAGEFDPAIPTSVMLTLFFGLLSPMGYERLLIREQIPPEELVRHVGRIYFDGIVTKK
jgi:TetR/AcrR family transcriptional regulator, fatty acid metabolism regulator protein